jgi:hypothetical protein
MTAINDYALVCISVSASAEIRHLQAIIIIIIIIIMFIPWRCLPKSF